MSTRSRIGLKLKDDSVLSVYHHYDGYPEWLGVTLNKKFNTFDKVAELLDGGDISSCDSDTNWKREKVDNHVLYYNDNGEKTEPRLDTNIEDYLDNGEEFAYLFEDNQWVCYDLHYDTPMDVPIPQKSEEAVA